MKAKLSELMDGELGEVEAQALFSSMRQDGELRERWLEYQLIGDALKGEHDLATELTGRVMSALEAEPTVLAPRPPAPSREVWQRKIFALAAAVSGVGVVGWLALGIGQPPTSPEPLAQAPQSTPVVVAKDKSAEAVQPVRQASADMHEYLVAHEAQSSSLQFRGGAEHIRTVAAVGMAKEQ